MNTKQELSGFDDKLIQAIDKITKGINMKDQVIKVGDYVYIPSLTIQCLKVYLNDAGRLEVKTDDFICRFNKDGTETKYCRQPYVFLASPENKAKIEAFYGIELEDIHVDEEVSAFIAELNKLSSFWANLSSNSKDVKASNLHNEIVAIKTNLIQMFKERGSK